MSEPDGDIHQDEFPARLRQAIAAFGSVTSLAHAIGRSDGAVRKWLRGVSEPSVSDLRAICLSTGVDIDWLVTGRGDSGLAFKGVREISKAYGATAPARLDGTLLDGVLQAL